MDNTPRILFSAPKSGSGKTTITCACLSAFLSRNISVSSFKCGPDYIDLMFHRKVIGVFANNLDLFFSNEQEVRALLKKHSQGSTISILEGVMGYYDGLAGLSDVASSYHLSKATETPTILILDAKGASLSISALIKGFAEFREQSNIKGIILNNCSETLYSLLKKSIEKETGINVTGYFPTMAECHFESRHLGLITAEEIEDIEQKIKKLGEMFLKTVDIDALLLIANSAEAITDILPIIEPITDKSPVIAVASDAAFCFYYQENLDVLKELGATIKEFSPLCDSEIPKEASALYFGGGYPEHYAEKLSKNKSMIESIKKASKNKIPIFAECGGFLYLNEKLQDNKKEYFPMVGLIKSEGFKTEKLSRFGYITLKPQKKNRWLTGEIKAHEFHYWDSTDIGEAMLAVKPVTQRRWACGHIKGNIFAGFAHLYFRSNISFAKQFVKLAEEHSKKNA